MYEEIGRKAESHVLVTEKERSKAQNTEREKTQRTVENGGKNPENSDERNHNIQCGPPLHTD